MEKHVPYEKLSKKGSDPTAAGGGYREGSEWQRSARCKSALSDAASVGHRNREQRKLDLARRNTWNSLNPVTRKPANSKAYNRNKARNWKRDDHEPIPGIFISHIYHTAPAGSAPDSDTPRSNAPPCHEPCFWSSRFSVAAGSWSCPARSG